MSKSCATCKTSKEVRVFSYPDAEYGTINLCWEHAPTSGFCPMCGYFVLGSPDDRTLGRNGVCVECLEELKIEAGEYDEEWD